jgi:hypothetical protein
MLERYGYLEQLLSQVLISIEICVSCLERITKKLYDCRVYHESPFSVTVKQPMPETSSEISVSI